MQRFTLFKGRNGKGKLREFSQCKECWAKSKQLGDRKESGGTSQLNTGALFDILAEVTMRDSTQDGMVEAEQECSDIVGTLDLSSRKSVTLDDQIFDGTDGWRTSESKKQPSLKLTVCTKRSDYDQLHIPYPQVGDERRHSERTV